MGLDGFLLIDVWHNCLKTDLIVDWKIVAPAARLFFSVSIIFSITICCVSLKKIIKINQFPVEEKSLNCSFYVAFY